MKTHNADNERTKRQDEIIQGLTNLSSKIQPDMRELAKALVLEMREAEGAG